ncbi:hypothetical protein [Brevibacterium sp. RIT 803]|uniref:hypothetical protein n=1 Tax=Brevibacterium sp. RIT 803 TaxID=2810210 RepID=UPI0019503BED|nr:hypothetical protein [Brevibacterium sp. RIT 803]MBM6591113.1 hypothetical protein [Brevibacterium sp. RIT 803]
MTRRPPVGVGAFITDGLEWEAKSVHNDTPAFTRVRVSDEALQATMYEVPASGAQQPESQRASEKIDDVEIARAGGEAPESGTDVDADANVEADSADAGGGSNSVDAATCAVCADAASSARDDHDRTVRAVEDST